MHIMAYNRKTSYRLSLIFIILMMCVSCARVQNIEENQSISISEHIDDNHEINPDSIIQLAYEEVNIKLPGANLIFFSYVGTCSTLLDLDGQYTFLFTRSSWRPLGNRTYSADVVINVKEETLDIVVEDVSEHYLSTTSMELNGKELIEAISMTQNALRAEGKCVGTIVLAKGSTKDTWGIRCGEPDKVYIECMEININEGM